MSATEPNAGPWPELRFDEWEDTQATLHMWTQIVGKIRLVQTPWINHSWHVPLYVTARGLSTSPIPHGNRIFDMEFDFVGHELAIHTGEGDRESIELRPRSVADFYDRLMGALDGLGLGVQIHTTPNEVADPIPFEQDQAHASYDADAVNRFWRVLVQTHLVFQEFRARFTGKCSPVHFFWGSFDMAVTRFSGRPAPPHPGGIPHLPDWVTREAYSHEVSSAGFWPGGGPLPFPLFYSYAYPVPEGFSEATVSPDGAYYDDQMGEFVLPYEVVHDAVSPKEALLEFLETTYQAAAGLAGWDAEAFELSIPA